MILTPYNDPYFYLTLATPLPSPVLPRDMWEPQALVFRPGEMVGEGIAGQALEEYLWGGEWDAREEELEEDA